MILELNKNHDLGAAEFLSKSKEYIRFTSGKNKQTNKNVVYLNFRDSPCDQLLMTVCPEKRRLSDPTLSF